MSSRVDGTILGRKKEIEPLPLGMEMGYLEDNRGKVEEFMLS